MAMTHRGSYLREEVQRGRVKELHNVRSGALRMCVTRRDTVKTKYQMLTRFSRSPSSYKCFFLLKVITVKKISTLFTICTQLTSFDQFIDIIGMVLISIIDATHISDAG